MNRRHLHKTGLAAVALSALTVFSACAGLGRSLQRPEVNITSVRVAETHLTAAELVFEFEVDNPNATALVLDEIGYRLRLNGEPLLDGRRAERTRIEASGESRIELPVTIRYQDLFKVIRSFEGRRGRPDYALDADFRFDVPILGFVTVPVRETGSIPIDRFKELLSLYPPGE